MAALWNLRLALGTTCSQISRITLEKSSLGIRRLVVFWNFRISSRALVPGRCLLLPGVPAPPGLFVLCFTTSLPFLGVPAEGLEVEGRESFSGNFFPETLGYSSDGRALLPVDFLKSTQNWFYLIVLCALLFTRHSSNFLEIYLTGRVLIDYRSSSVISY